MHESFLVNNQSKSESPLFQKGINPTTAILWMSDKDGKCTYLSKKWNEFTGNLHYQKAMENRLADIHPEDRQEVSRVFFTAHDQQKAFILEYRLKSKRDRYRWVIDAGNPRYDKQNNFIGFAGTILDIQEQKVSAIDLNLKSQVIENSLNGFDIVDENGTFIYVNSAYVKMWGYDSADEIIGTSPASHCANPNVPVEIISRLKKEGACDIEFVAKRKDGSLFDARMLAFLATDASGKEIYPTTSIDITKQKRFEEKLKENESRFRLLIDSMPQMAFIADPEGNMIFYNKQHYAYFGIGMYEKEKWRWLSQNIHHPDDLERTITTWKHSLKTGEPYQIEYRLRRCDGTYRWHLGRANPVRDKNGKIFEWLGTNTDIHDQKMAESKLFQAKEVAENANQLKSSFLANMSHEIRTPLGAMIGFADLLKDPNLGEEERKKCIDILIRNGEQLSFLINDILDLSKIEADQMRMETLPFKPKELLEDIITLLNIKAKDKGLHLQHELDDSIDIVHTDPHRVRQILLNLIGNSIKFTNSGSIHIKCSKYISSTNKNMIEFEISDTGVGIPEDQINKIFNMFVQVDNSNTKKVGGTGLGLALSRSLARKLGGDVVIKKSKVNEGTTLTFFFEDHIPKKSSTENIKSHGDLILQEEERKKLKGKRVLVVDDAPDNRLLIQHYLERESVVVEVAENGQQAYEMAMQSVFDVILMDIQMPIMDGYLATEKLRFEGYKNPIIALTAHAMSEVRERCLKVGFDDHLTKPINSQDLVKTIYNYSCS